jgi:hypothetical protein
MAICLPYSARTWFFAALFALIVRAAQFGQPAQAEDAPNQTVPPPSLYLPALVGEPSLSAGGCPLASPNQYTATPLMGAPRRSDPAPAQDADLNLALRSFVTTTRPLALVDIGGDTDLDPPQLAQLFRPPRLPAFAAVYQVYEWDWACPGGAAGQGCRGQLLVEPEVTLVSMTTTPGETLYPPGRQADILGDIYIALVLYADETQLTFTYTREDSPANGYLIHLEELCVDPNLLRLYRSLDQARRTTLPGLRPTDPLGTARLLPLRVAVRDTGSFMDPRSRKDWWQGY